MKKEPFYITMNLLIYDFLKCYMDRVNQKKIEETVMKNGSRKEFRCTWFHTVLYSASYY